MREMAMYKGLARVYDLLRDKSEYDIWPGYILGLLDEYGCKKGANIIDAACGTGDMAIELRNAGYKVTGIDISGDMLQIAQEKARQSGADITFICQDIKNLNVHKPVDSIICINDGVNYLKDECSLNDFLYSSKSNLKQNGLLMFDISSKCKLEEMAGQVYTYDTDDIAYIWNNSLSKDGILLRMDITFFIRNEHGSFDRFEESHVQRIYGIDYLRDALAGAGFFIEAIFSCFTRNAPEPESKRIQIIARNIG